MDENPPDELLDEISEAVETLQDERLDVQPFTVCKEQIDSHGLVCSCGNHGSFDSAFNLTNVTNPHNHVWISFFVFCPTCSSKGEVRVSPAYAKKTSEYVGGPSVRRRNASEPITPKSNDKASGI